jgi:hypothetical protein
MQFMKPAAAALALAMATTSFASSADARSRYYHRHHGGEIGAGIAGFAAGAFLGALARPHYSYGYYDDYYAPGYYYEQPRYYAPAPVYVAPPRAYYREEPRYYRPGCDSDGSVSRPANSLC